MYAPLPKPAESEPAYLRRLRQELVYYSSMARLDERTARVAKLKCQAILEAIYVLDTSEAAHLLPQVRYRTENGAVSVLTNHNIQKEKRT